MSIVSSSSPTPKVKLPSQSQVHLSIAILGTEKLCLQFLSARQDIDSSSSSDFCALVFWMINEDIARLFDSVVLTVCSAAPAEHSSVHLNLRSAKGRYSCRCFFFSLLGVFSFVKTGRSRLFCETGFFFRLGEKMSDVRLSNGSPTLERTDARVSDHPKPSACRNLFGRGDPEELNADFKGQMREMEEAASAKWGFDFASNTPLVNDMLEWELVDYRALPGFYSRPLRREKGVCSAGNNNVDLNGNHNCVLVAPGEDSDRSDGQMEQCIPVRKRAACHGTKKEHRLFLCFFTPSAAAGRRVEACRNHHTHTCGGIFAPASIK